MSDQVAFCENCDQNKAVTNCEACGAKVCSNCKLEFGCKLCNQGRKRI